MVHEACPGVVGLQNTEMNNSEKDACLRTDLFIRRGLSLVSAPLVLTSSHSEIASQGVFGLVVLQMQTREGIWPAMQISGPTCCIVPQNVPPPAACPHIPLTHRPEPRQNK
jgi:hypothetical protein